MAFNYIINEKEVNGMKDKIQCAVASIIAIALFVLGFVFGFEISDLQKKVLNILLIIMVSSMAYCFIVGELSHNNSQMDKLWSVLPIAYVWIIFGFSHMNIRCLVIAIIVTLWGARLTFNFAEKGAYQLKFWAGEEDYRWAILRSTKPFDNKIVWAIFDFGFISVWQNIVIVGICLPSLAVMETTSFTIWDGLIAALAVAFFALEIVADYQQNLFQNKKYEYLKQGKKLEELPAPYHRGFNVSGLWGRMRHPNYLGEQGIWVSLYLFVISAGIAKYGIFNWTMFGCLLLILIFLGSSRMAEGISVGKYKEYQAYQKQVFKYLLIRKYQEGK